MGQNLFQNWVKVVSPACLSDAVTWGFGFRASAILGVQRRLRPQYRSSSVVSIPRARFQASLPSMSLVPRPRANKRW